MKYKFRIAFRRFFCNLIEWHQKERRGTGVRMRTIEEINDDEDLVD